MSEIDTGIADTGANVSSESTLVEPRSDQDWFLQELVGFANYRGLSTTITLNLAGSVISGQLISSETYIDEFATEFKNGFKNDPESGQFYFDLISSFKPKSDDGNLIPPPHYIHLRNVRTYGPGRPQHTLTSALWRGRISEVSGFTLGEPPKPDPS